MFLPPNSVSSRHLDSVGGHHYASPFTSQSGTMVVSVVDEIATMSIKCFSSALLFHQTSESRTCRSLFEPHTIH